MTNTLKGRLGFSSSHTTSLAQGQQQPTRHSSRIDTMFLPESSAFRMGTPP